MKRLRHSISVLLLILALCSLTGCSESSESAYEIPWGVTIVSDQNVEGRVQIYRNGASIYDDRKTLPFRFNGSVSMPQTTTFDVIFTAAQGGSEVHLTAHIGDREITKSSTEKTLSCVFSTRLDDFI